MARAMWRGTISFGMVAIPVRLYLATESKRISFRLLCPEHHMPIKNKRWCPEGDHEVAWNATVRGYEIAKDEYVEITDAELDQLTIPTSRQIEILEFCPNDDIDTGVYLQTAYYLEPEPAGARPYALLQHALSDTDKVAIGKVAFRDREHLCRVALHKGGLLMNTLYWPDEIRDVGELRIPEGTEVHQREIDMAKMLVENLSARFDPDRYKDDYREAVIALAEAKLGSEPLPKTESAAEPKVMDLMAALQASVDAAKEGRLMTAAKTSKPSSRKRKAS